MPDGAYLSSMEIKACGPNRIYGVYSLAFSPDGQTLAICIGDGLVVLRNLRGRECLVMGKNHPIYANILAFSPDGRTLVCAVNKTVCLWGLPDGMLQWRQPDDTTRHLPMKILESHEGSITSLTISPDGRIIASGSEDCTVRLWRLPDGAPLNILKGHSGAVCSLAFNPDGKTLASGCADNVVWLWSLNPFYRIPISQANQEDMDWAHETLRNGDLNAEERNVLEFITALIRLRRRFDIQLGEPTRRIEAGELDIEIEG
jgi:WD40 repeat protein